MSALGVVYGDIGTSPLYALKEVFGGAHHPVPINEANVLGILSLVFWALMIVVSIKYIVFIMRANNKGEGGIMALMALVLRGEKDPARARVLMLMGLFGAALFYGDGLITPAISVLSAVEGLEVATPAFKPYVIPVTLIVLVVLFAVQKRGTGSVGALFGPVMIVWFVTLATLGSISIARTPQVLRGAQSAVMRSGSLQRTARSASFRSARWCSWSPARKRSMPTWVTSEAAPCGSPGRRSCSRRSRSTTSVRARCSSPTPSRSRIRSTCWLRLGRSTRSSRSRPSRRSSPRRR